MVDFNQFGRYTSIDVPVLESSQALLSQLDVAMEDNYCNEALGDCPEESVLGAFEMQDEEANKGNVASKSAVEEELNTMIS